MKQKIIIPAILIVSLVIASLIPNFVVARNSEDYSNEKHGFSFSIPDNLRILERKDIQNSDLLKVIDIYPKKNDRTENGGHKHHRSSISVTVYDMGESNSSISEWLDLHDSTRTSPEEYSKSNVFFHGIHNLTEVSEEIVIFWENFQGEYVTVRTLIQNDDKIIAINHHRAEDGRNLNNFYINVLKSLKKYPSNEDFLPNLSNTVKQTIKEYPSTMNAPESNLETSLVASKESLTTSSTISYKLPWPKSHKKKVNQGWGSGSHVGNQSYAYDFGIWEGQKVLASSSGKVSWIKKGQSLCGGSDYSSFTNLVVINHPDGKATQYLHLSSVAVTTGQQVEQGQLIGYAGATGYTDYWETGNCYAHLHFQKQKQSTYSWATQATPIYFDEYPGQQLQWPNEYQSQNEYNPVSTTCGDANVELNIKIEPGQHYFCGATNKLTLKPGFHAKSGSLTNIYIE